jgi:hypothetical protein
MEIKKKSGLKMAQDRVKSSDVTLGTGSVPSSNAIKGAELEVKTNLNALKKNASVPSAIKVADVEEAMEAPSRSDEYKARIQKRLKK